MIQKKFNFGFGELQQRCDNVVALLVRDALQFSDMGYEQDFQDNLEAKTIEFKAIQSDTYWKGQQMLKTDEKNEARVALRNGIGNLQFRAKRALGADSVEYRSFGFSRLSDLDEPQLIVFAWHVIKTAKNMLEALAVRKVEEGTLDNIAALASKLDDAIDNQKRGFSIREEKAFERREKGNALYAFLVEACDVGKQIWDNVNPAYYDDYVIYGSQSSMNEEEQDLDEVAEVEEDSGS